jgi:guanosine-3',5'-bis(diphosphate) 3'-pyrophosphohydrolase
VPLSVPLTNGQTVEILTAPGANPNPAWLNFLVTGKAKSNVRHFLKCQHHTESVKLGYRLLEKAFSDSGSDYTKVPPESLQALLYDLHYKTEDELLYAIGDSQAIGCCARRRYIGKGPR